MGNVVYDIKIWGNDVAENKTLEYDFDATDEIVEDIMSFKDEDGSSISPDLIDRAIRIHNVARYYGYKTEPHLNINGTITIICSLSDHFLDVEIINDNIFKLRYEIGKGKDYEVVWRNRIGNFDYVETKLIQIKAQCQTSSLESLDLNPTAKTKEDLGMMSYFKIITTGFQYLIDNALNSQPPKESAHT